MSSINETRKVDFLHVPPPGGIDFDELKRRIHAGELDGLLDGLSGKPLTFSVIDLPEKKALTIIDDEDPLSECHLTAMLQPLDTLNLSLSRKYKPPRSGRHPDLKAAPFVDFSLNFFAGLGLKITKFQGVWEERSDNYALFMEEHEANGDAVAAAKNTWSGRTMGDHGFTVITEKDIEIDPGKARVKALFRKPFQ